VLIAGVIGTVIMHILLETERLRLRRFSVTDVMAGRGEDERRAVKYAARRHDWLAAK
jgi:hypothetical protein